MAKKKAIVIPLPKSTAKSNIEAALNSGANLMNALGLETKRRAANFNKELANIDIVKGWNLAIKTAKRK
jgi:hypothetical protein